MELVARSALQGVSDTQLDADPGYLRQNSGPGLVVFKGLQSEPPTRSRTLQMGPLQVRFGPGLWVKDQI